MFRYILNLMKIGSSGIIGSIKSLFIYGFIALVLYFVFGIAYNMKINGF